VGVPGPRRASQVRVRVTARVCARACACACNERVRLRVCSFVCVFICVHACVLRACARAFVSACACDCAVPSDCIILCVRSDHVCVRLAAACAPHRTAATCGIYSSTRAARRRPRVRGCARCHRPGSRASAAGVSWTRRTANALWAARQGHTSVVDAAGAIYVIGGFGPTAPYDFNDVWVSTDGGARPDSVQGVVGEVLEGVLEWVLRGY
jgi:hypothetical protein